ncbi:EamA family transporter, partial [Pseudomonas sp. K8]|uniref:EamA family transporter n=1 Tax=Pseudomonas sp. K8 TaxID=212200 RepID=UPI001D011DDC
STVLVVAWLLLSNGTGWWKQIAAQPRALPTLALSSMAIAFNWGLYIWAINAGHVIETSLGYFINPLVSVVLGVVVLKERLRGLQWLAVGCAALGVAWLTLDAGTPPWVARGLGCSFGPNGRLRKMVSGSPVAGLSSGRVRRLPRGPDTPQPRRAWLYPWGGRSAGVRAATQGVALRGMRQP